MSQEYYKSGESSLPSRREPLQDDGEQKPQYQTPQYMTIGADGPSESAQKLAAILDNDSGYGSISDGDWRNAWHPNRMAESPLPGGAGGTDPHSEHERRTMASHIHQLQYNHNRTALGRAITRTLDSLRRLQDYNQQWPAHYPSIQPPSPVRRLHDPRPGPHHTQSNQDDCGNSPITRPSPLRRAETTRGEAMSEVETEAISPQKPPPEPRLVTPQLARDFSVLKIDLKMDGMPQTEIIHSLRKDSKALAQLLDGQLSKSMRHLSLLRERIEDTSSKVLVTGDLNAGKSTFCNALLRRKILPEDEQPCTSIFCEVLDVRENAGLEEVHAIPKGCQYHRHDERTYQVFPLQKLEKVVVDAERYSQCKVYIKDIRTVDESLLNNGVLDIALIDAPGLNNDSIKTTAVFARQEEIDVVVFVVSAANHFTLSAREFIYDAAREKAFIFMVVNGFDNIKNKERCQKNILGQVANLSPATFKESSELVHFVSSNAIPVAPISGSSASVPSSFGSGPSRDPGDGPEDDDDDDEPLAKHGEPGDVEDSGNKNKGKEREKVQDFEQLEASLRRFVLEKRARSKLAPAKTYLVNVLEDLNSLASVNRDVAQSEFERVAKELQDLEPVLNQSRKARNQASDNLDQSMEDAASNVYSFSRDTLNTTIGEVSQRDLGVQYPGLWDSFQYAEEILSAMVQEISDSVGSCEEYARAKTGEGVNSIKSLGLLHLGDAFIDLHFQSDKMLRRKKDALARQVDVDIDMWDFFDFAGLWERQEKVAGTSMAVTVAGVLGGRMIGGVGWIDSALSAMRIVGVNNLRKVFIPGLLATVAIGVSYAIASIPQSLPRRLSQKLSTQLMQIDFTHSNALRISSEVRKALKIPADNLRIGLTRQFETLQSRREETSKIRGESEVALKYFGNLVRESGETRGQVDRVDLEGPAPGVAGGFEA